MCHKERGKEKKSVMVILLFFIFSWQLAMIDRCGSSRSRPILRSRSSKSIFLGRFHLSNLLIRLGQRLIVKLYSSRRKILASKIHVILFLIRAQLVRCPRWPHPLSDPYKEVNRSAVRRWKAGSIRSFICPPKWPPMRFLPVLAG